MGEDMEPRSRDFPERGLTTEASVLGLLEFVPTPVMTYGRANSVGRVLVDVLQELARHLGHLDITRERIDGSTGA